MIDDDPLYAAIQDGSTPEVAKQLYPDLLPPGDDKRQFEDAGAEIIERLGELADWRAGTRNRMPHWDLPPRLEAIIDAFVAAWEAFDGEALEAFTDGP